MTVKSDNPNVKSIKHMAFAVSDAEAALAAYAKFLHVPADTEITHFAKSGNKVALFHLGGIEIEFMQVYTPEELAAWEASKAEAV
jgi:methylmalonyl-CoA/ethylmalonyl-CoA epimerase